MGSQASGSQVGTRRVLAAAVVVVLIVVLALWMRRDRDEFVVAQAAPVPSIAQRVDATPSPTAVPVASATPAATPASVDSHDTLPNETKERLPVATFHIRADLEGGCAFPPDAQVAFMQIMPGDQPAIIERVALADAGVDGGYKHFWQPDAIALSVLVETEMAAVPGVTIERSVLDSRMKGELFVAPLLAKELLNPGNGLAKGTRAADLILNRGGLLRRLGTPRPEADESSITLSMTGACFGSIVLELPADAPHSIIDDVEVFSPRVFQAPGFHMRFPVEGLSGKLYTEGSDVPVQFEQVPGELKIHPLYPGTYAIQLRTADSRIWTAEDVVLEAGGETRLRVELKQGAHITARVVGASSPSAEIRYRLGGLPYLGDAPVVAAKIPKPPVKGGLARDPRGVVRAGTPMEFIAIPGGAYTVFATESADRWGNAFVAIETGEHREVVIDFGSLVPVTIDVVDQDGKPVQGDNTFISVWQKRPGANYWAIRVNGEGRATEKFPPGSYRLTYDGKDSRESAEISVSVVSPGDGDYFKMVVNKTVKLRGRVVDVAKKPLKGVDLRAAILPAFHWREADTAAVSNDLGEFELVVPEGSVLIQAKHENLHKEVHTPAPLPEGEVLEIVMESLAIRGVLLDRETREPVAKQWVACLQYIVWKSDEDQVAEGLHFIRGESAKTDENGTFRIGNLAPGIYVLRANERGIEPRSGGKVVELKSANDPPVTIYTEGEAATLAGTIRSEEGAPISKMELFAIHRTGDPPMQLMSSVCSDNEGHYEAKNLDPGENLTAIFIQANHDTQPRYFLAHLAEGITLREGETTTYDFVATSGARLVVSVMTAEGSPVRGAEIRLMQGGDEVIDQARLTPGPTMTDRNGRLMYRAIPPGTYTARATLADGRKIEGTISLGVWEDKTLTLRAD